MKKTFFIGLGVGVLIVFTIPEFFTPISMNGDSTQWELIGQILGFSKGNFPEYVYSYIMKRRIQALGFILISGVVFVLGRYIVGKIFHKKS